jgi:excisionase family DNA binding protein
MNTSPTRTINTPTRTNQTSAPATIDMLTVQEVAERLGVSLQRAYEMGRCGLLPIVRMGRQIRVEEARLMSWIESGGRGLPGGWKRYPR